MRRIARLKRFDMEWQAALQKIDAAKLSPVARTDLQTLQATIRTNLAQLDTDATAVAAIMPMLPFATTLIDLSEARIRLEDVDARKAAGQLTAVAQQIADARAKLEKEPATVPGPARRSPATRAAEAVDGLRASMTTWFNFSNGYDPLFTWWMGMPYQKLDAALQGYGGVPARAAGARDATHGVAAAAPIAPSAAPAVAEVPDLPALIALPQDEMTPVVQRFIGAAGAGGRGRDQQPGRGPAEAVLRRLAGRAQDARLRSPDPQRAGRLPVHPKRRERYLARVDAPLDPNPPRKTDNTGHHRRGARPRRPHPRSRRRADPVHAGTADRARREGVRLVRRGDAQGVARRWDSATTGSRRSRR